MDGANVTFSQEERELLNDAGLILTKNRIIGKITGMLGETANRFREMAAVLAGAANGERILAASPKVSKGESYEGLPWAMLDYPRCFTVTDVFAIRSFFWWGHHVSITLHLAGSFIPAFGKSIEAYFSDPALREGWYINVGQDAWQHHFRQDNYMPLGSSGLVVPEGEGLLKLAKKIPLAEWNGNATFFTENYAALLKMLGCRLMHPDDGKAL
ncbi:hypothetical protein [Sediminibacterium ginsengisoli]|uniref:Uncharacterized protein n=1 Tax=Sediminibacterium ginsengisoli TaxID=413434 RepID=A0A1T4NC43_9BACT|nr:hypothetical protein [Sediminibacterium ginsengisoli]SJZ76663.1 hypothetical protein SAMN04488132_104192 [Sediminibacterium ginsengisoli]